MSELPAESLEAAVESLVNLGEKDPHAILAKLERRNGSEWLREQAAAYYAELVTDIARRSLNSRRRASVAAIRPGQPLTSAEMKLRGTWVPADGSWEWKALAEFTAADHDARARWLERMAIGVLKSASWHREVAEMIRAAGVADTGRLRQELPPLPTDAELELPALEDG